MKNDSSAARLPKMTSFRRFLVFIAVVILLVGVLNILDIKFLRQSQDVESVDSLSGQRIGCCVGWETDYILTKRDDITLLRYDDNATALVALSFNQVDAVGLDGATYAAVSKVTEGLTALPETLGAISYVAITPLEKAELCGEFNDFAARFRESGEYEDFINRALLENSDTFVEAEVEELSAGDILRVGYSNENYPESYYDSVSGRPSGYGVEMLKRFAADRGYRLEFVSITETSAAAMIETNTIDIVVCGITDVYREEYEMVACVTDSYFDVDVLLAVVADGQKLKMTGLVES